MARHGLSARNIRRSARHAPKCSRGLSIVGLGLHIEALLAALSSFFSHVFGPMTDSTRSLQHRLAVVWFTDLVGWSSLASRDEDRAIALVRRFQAAVRD